MMSTMWCDYTVQRCFFHCFLNFLKLKKSLPFPNFLGLIVARGKAKHS